MEECGLELPIISETERLSDLEYQSIYYEPKEKPTIALVDCVDLCKFDQKVECLNNFELTASQKSTLKMFAYRFIKIDFESVANYYAFNASEEEQKAIEQLRLVLTDSGVDGFVEDDLLRILEIQNEMFGAFADDD